MIMKVDGQSFPMVPKSGPKVVIIIKILHLKTISHFRSRTLYIIRTQWCLFGSTDKLARFQEMNSEQEVNNFFNILWSKTT